MELSNALIQQLSSKGILAYVAVSQIGDGTVSTATLAGLVKAQTSAVLEGLRELSILSPETVRQVGRKWECGKGGEGIVVQNLDSTRWVRFIALLDRYWKSLNPGIPFNISNADGAAIRQFLKDHPSWEEDVWTQCLAYRWNSVVKFGNGSRTEDFHRWIRRLGDYAAGPINNFNKPVEGSGNAGKTIDIRNRNREAVTRAIARA